MSITKTRQLILFSEVITAYCQNLKKPTDTLYIHTFRGSTILSQDNRMQNTSETYKNIQHVQNFTLKNTL